MRLAGGRNDVDLLRSLMATANATPPARSDGARSRAATATLLSTLAPLGFQVVLVEDDHLVLGPSGTWLVASQDFAYPLSLGRRGDLWTGCYPVGSVLGPLVRCAQTIGVDLGAPVEPVLAVHRASVPGRHLAPQGVQVVEARRALVPLLREGPPRLAPAEAAKLAARARSLRSVSPLSPLRPSR